jgi:hypothetical protein
MTSFLLAQKKQTLRLGTYRGLPPGLKPRGRGPLGAMVDGAALGDGVVVAGVDSLVTY